MNLLLIEVLGTLAAFCLFYLDHVANERESDL